MTKKEQKLISELVKSERRRHHDTGKVHVVLGHVTPSLVVLLYEVAGDIWVASAPYDANRTLGRPHRGSLRYLMKEGL